VKPTGDKLFAVPKRVAVTVTPTPPLTVNVALRAPAAPRGIKTTFTSQLSPGASTAPMHGLPGLDTWKFVGFAPPNEKLSSSR